jgi:hypothetical protein
MSEITDIKKTRRHWNAKTRSDESLASFMDDEESRHLDGLLDNGVEFDISDDEMILQKKDAHQQALVDCSSCKGGQVPNPSVYRPFFTVSNSNEISDFIQDASILDQLYQTSIVPVTEGNGVIRDDFAFPRDAVNHLDVHAKGLAMFKPERRLSQATTSKTLLCPREHPKLFLLVVDILRRFGPDYSQVLVQNIFLEKAAMTLTINPRGSGSRMCPVNKVEHKTNRFFVKIFLKNKKASVRMYCYKKECREVLTACRDPKKKDTIHIPNIEFNLPYENKSTLKKLLSLHHKMVERTSIKPPQLLLTPTVSSSPPPLKKAKIETLPHSYLENLKIELSQSDCGSDCGLFDEDDE